MAFSASFSLTPAGSSLAAFPDRAERNPKKKTPDWIAQWGRAFCEQALRQTSANPRWYHASSVNETRLKYAFGQQDAAQYELFRDAATAQTDPTGLSARIDRRILRVVPKHIRILSDKLAERSFAPSVTVVDEQAEAEEQEHLDTIRLWQEQGQFLKEQDIAPPAELPADLPEDEDDLSIYRDTTYQHADAVAMEEKLSLALTECNYKQLDRDVVLNFFLFGEACLYCGSVNGRPVPYLILPGRCLFLDSAYEDYRDMRAGAHIEYLDLGQLKAEAGDQLTAEQYKIVEQQAVGRTSDWWLPDGMGSAADSGKVTVVRFSFISEDDMVWKTRTTSAGNEQTRRKSTDYQNTTPGTVSRRTAQNVYEGTLIVGTDLSYNCRRAVEQLRDPDNILRGLLPYVVMSPGMLVGQSSCPMDEVMPMADYVQQQWVKLQDACLRIVPQGYNFDPERLLESALMLKQNTDSGIDLKPLTEAFYRTGNSVSKTTGKSGEQLPPAITPRANAEWTNVLQFWNNLRSGLQMLESIMGSNAVVSGATPNPETGKGTSELAVAGTLSSLGYLAHAKAAMYELICRAMGIRIWLTEARQPLTGSFSRRPGQAAVRVKARPELSKRRFNFSFEPVPTAQEWQQFEAVLQRALDNKEITAVDFAHLKDVANPKRARFILANRAKRNERRLMQQAEQNQQATMEGQAQAAERAEAAKQQTIQVQLRADMQLETLKGQNAQTVAMIYADAQHQAEQARVAGRVQNTQVQQAAAAERDAARDERSSQQELMGRALDELGQQQAEPGMVPAMPQPQFA